MREHPVRLVMTLVEEYQLAVMLLVAVALVVMVEANKVGEAVRVAVEEVTVMVMEAVVEATVAVMVVAEATEAAVQMKSDASLKLPKTKLATHIVGEKKGLTDLIVLG